MDISYILHNTLIYGIMAFALARILSHNKYLSFAIGAFLIWIGYVFQSIFTSGFEWFHVVHLLVIFTCCYVIDVFIYRSFRHEYIRDLFGLIFTMGFSILVVNGLLFTYGPTPVSIDIPKISDFTLLITICLLRTVIYYVYKYSVFGKITGGIYENSKVIETLSVKRSSINFVNTIFTFFLLMIASYTLLSSSSLAPGDEVFYAIKGIGIFIIVGVHRLEYMFLGAFIYVCMEHILFINLGLPLNYKESVVLGIILLVLIFKPQGIFSFKTRKI